MYLLGYDIGSDYIRAALVRADDQQVVRVTRYPEREFQIISSQKGWAEQEPLMWWNAVSIVTKKLLFESGVSAEKILSIGISYQMHGLVAIDKLENVIRPSIIWCDSRAVAIGAKAFKELGINYCLHNLLNSPGNFTASKAHWLKVHEPDKFERIDKILLPGEYIVMKMTGAKYTTISGLSEGIFWNFKNRTIDTHLIDYFGLEQKMLPEIKPTFGTVGVLSESAATFLGLKKNLPVSYRAGDQPNNALALNVLQKGEIAATSGSSGVVYGIVEHLMYDVQSRINAFAHVNYEEDFSKIGILLCINGAGAQYNWLKRNVARKTTDLRDMDLMAASVPIGAGGVTILPFGNGSERMLNDQEIDSHIFNIQFNQHSRAHIYRAALESVGYSFVYGINILKDIGLRVDKIRVPHEHMFRSEIFAKTIASLMQTEIEVYDTTGAVGAALGAGIGISYYASAKEALLNVKPIHSITPSLDYARSAQSYNYWLQLLYNTHNKQKNPDKTAESKSGSYELHKQLEDQRQAISLLRQRQRNLNETLEEVKSTLKSIASKDVSEETRRSMNEVIRLMNKQDHAEVYSEHLKDHYKIISDDFIQQIKRKFPRLRFDDLELIYLLKYQMSSKEIATMLGISVRGVETRRYRLRKKLGLSRKEDLISFIAEG